VPADGLPVIDCTVLSRYDAAAIDLHLPGDIDYAVLEEGSMKAGLQTENPVADKTSQPLAHDLAQASRSIAPGPVDRQSFSAAQLRNRRSRWRLSALCVLTSLLMGIPLAVVISPFICVVLILAADLANLIYRVPDLAALAMREIASGTSGSPSPLIIFQNMALLLAPGMAFMLLVWIAMRALFVRCGAGGLLLALKAREPHSERYDELVLADVVAEIGVAAGIKPPRLRVLDLESANAAAVGSTIDDSVLVVSRGLLARLSREELQGAIAHLVASVGNGDLRAAMEMLSLWRTIGLIGTAMETPFGTRSRALIRRVVGISFGRRGATGAEAEAISELLAGALDPNQTGDLQQFQKTHSTRLDIASVLLLPVMMAHIAFQLTELVLNVWFLGPLLALMWRSRRYLADAMAVQLTRNPQGLAGALLRLADPGMPTAIAAGTMIPHLFLTWPHAGRREGLGASTLMSFQPRLENRLRRLNAMGANVQIPHRNSFWHTAYHLLESGKLGPAGRLLLWGVCALVLFLIAVLFCLSIVLVPMIVVLSLMFDMMLMLPIVALLHYKLRYILHHP
jgi:Zn-dependent protease with chaperone function